MKKSSERNVAAGDGRLTIILIIIVILFVIALFHMSVLYILLIYSVLATWFTARSTGFKNFFLNQNATPFFKYHIRLISVIFTVIIAVISINDFVFNRNYNIKDSASIIKFIDKQIDLIKGNPYEIEYDSSTRNNYTYFLIDKTKQHTDSTLREWRETLLKNISKYRSLGETRYKSYPTEDLLVINALIEMSQYKDLSSYYSINYYLGNVNGEPKIVGPNRSPWIELNSINENGEGLEFIEKIDAVLESIKNKLHVERNTFYQDIFKMIKDVTSAERFERKSNVTVIVVSDFIHDLHEKNLMNFEAHNLVNDLLSTDFCKIDQLAAIVLKPDSREVSFEEKKDLRNSTIDYLKVADNNTVKYVLEESKHGSTDVANFISNITRTHSITDVLCLPNELNRQSFKFTNHKRYPRYNLSDSYFLYGNNYISELPILKDQSILQLHPASDAYGKKVSLRINDVKKMIPSILLELVSILLILSFFALATLIVKIGIDVWNENDKTFFNIYVSLFLLISIGSLCKFYFFIHSLVYKMISDFKLNDIVSLCIYVIVLIIIPSVYYWNAKMNTRNNVITIN
ncbi:MAG: hypothetical protein AAFQ94_20130 [Bacteroidota bacterium]